MKVSAVGLGVTACIALLLSSQGNRAAAHEAPASDFRLLKLSGHYVKWGAGTLGSGATVTYAFVDEPVQFSNARNCGGMIPMAGLAARSGILEATLQAEAAAAFRVWEDAADIVFVTADDPTQADILIGAQRTPTGRAFANVAYRPGSENGVKVIDQALICLNPNHQWKVGFDGDTDVYDIRYTFVHEIGHAIGLNHPGPSGQVMSFRYSEEYRDLQPGDILGAAVLYGEGTGFVVAGTGSDEHSASETVRVRTISLTQHALR